MHIMSDNIYGFLAAARFAAALNLDLVDCIEIDAGEQAVQLRIADRCGVQTVAARLGTWARSRTSPTTSISTANT
jgi:hypothetical protein